MATFPLELVSPEKLLFSEPVQTVVAPGIDGSFGVMAGHAPLLTELAVGVIKLTLASGLEAFIAVHGGYLQVTAEKVIILASAAELSEEIDVERAKAAAARARKQLEVPDGTGNAEELRRGLEKALTRLKVAQMRSAH